MRFSHKIVVASTVLLLLTIGLLSVQQLMTVRSEVEGLVSTSLREMVNGVQNTISSEMNNKKALAYTIAETIEIAPNDRDYVKRVLEEKAFFYANIIFQCKATVRSET